MAAAAARRRRFHRSSALSPLAAETTTPQPGGEALTRRGGQDPAAPANHTAPESGDLGSNWDVPGDLRVLAFKKFSFSLTVGGRNLKAKPC